METSRYDDVVSFVDAVVAKSDLLHVDAMGYTLEGRRIPMIVAGNVTAASAAAVHASGKLRIYLQGNIHAGEVCGKEALLMLLREIAGGEHDEWFDDVVLIIVPIYNADGNERVSLGNRPGQNGPFGGMGQRSNAQGLDLNRDHMKLESPEARSLLSMMRTYDPQVSVDLHTTNGTRHAYHVTYSPPLNPNTDPAIDELLRENWLPAMTERIRAKHGWEYYYSGNMPFRRDTEPGWHTFDHRPRFNNNYIGLRNRVAILSEAYAYASFEDRVLASLYFVQEIVAYAGEQQALIRDAIATAAAAVLPGTELGVRAAHAQSAAKVDILMGETGDGVHPLTGRRQLMRRDISRVESMYEYGSFRPTDRHRDRTGGLSGTGRVDRGRRSASRPRRAARGGDRPGNARSRALPRHRVRSCRSRVPGPPGTTPRGRVRSHRDAYPGRHSSRGYDPAARPAGVLSARASIGRRPGKLEFPR